MSIRNRFLSPGILRSARGRPAGRRHSLAAVTAIEIPNDGKTVRPRRHSVSGSSLASSNPVRTTNLSRSLALSPLVSTLPAAVSSGQGSLPSLAPKKSSAIAAVSQLVRNVQQTVPRRNFSIQKDKETPPLVIPPLFTLQPFNKLAPRPAGLEKKAVPFSGTVTVGAKNISIVPNTSISPQVIQFAHSDVVYFEDVVTLADPSGRSVPITRLWVKKGAKGVTVSSFVVGESARPI